MEFPREITERILELAAEENSRAMSKAAGELSERYRSNSGGGKPLVSGRRDILAYAAVRMPATFGAVGRALELALAHFDGEINSVLDAGAGTGAASLAAELLTDCREITCLERDGDMLSLCGELLECAGISAAMKQCDITDGFGEKADLVLSSYCLNEMKRADRAKTLEALWNAAEKLLVIVEPGTPEGFAQLKEARATLLSLGGHVVAPCPINGECPIEDGDWCHFTARIARTKLHKQLKGGDAPYEDEKFCFIAVSREQCSPCGQRILRHPRIESGRITLRLCGADGISDKMYTKKSALFKAARKADCGDEFPEE
jgi:ribosomal protein RSM22 (predicted rRNA methylase)